MMRQIFDYDGMKWNQVGICIEDTDGFFNRVDVGYTGGAQDGCIDRSKVALKIGCMDRIPEGKDNSFLLEIIDGLVVRILVGLSPGLDV